MPNPKNLKSNDLPEDLGRVAHNWIDYIKTNNKSYYKELLQTGTLNEIAKKKADEYYDTVEDLNSKGKYPPGGAEEVARMFLYPELYP